MCQRVFAAARRKGTRRRAADDGEFNLTVPIRRCIHDRARASCIGAEWLACPGARQICA